MFSQPSDWRNMGGANENVRILSYSNCYFNIMRKRTHDCRYTHNYS